MSREGMAVWMAFCVGMSMCVLGVGVWAVIKLVSWVVAQ